MQKLTLEGQKPIVTAQHTDIHEATNISGTPYKHDLLALEQKLSRVRSDLKMSTATMLRLRSIEERLHEEYLKKLRCDIYSLNFAS
jgi:hypothetical protein